MVKNLFFGTGRSILRKGAEASLVPVAEFPSSAAAHSGALPQVGRSGAPGIYEMRSRVPHLLRNRGPTYRPGQSGRLAAILPWLPSSGAPSA